MTNTLRSINEFREYLINEEKSDSTLESYIRNVEAFMKWIQNEVLDKKKVLEYKEILIENYKISTANAALSAINSFFEFCGLQNLKVKIFKKQKEIFYSENRELTKIEYEKLLKTALNNKNQRIYYIMQAICSTGIRVSELKFITVESLSRKYVEVRCKGKNRVVILPDSLCRILKEYAKSNGIISGTLFITRTGKPINRTVIWREMCELCKDAGVEKSKVFPHNLRHLFARTYYSLEKDIVRLADILGHSSVNTTRIYTMESGKIHRRHIQKMGLVILRE